MVNAVAPVEPIKLSQSRGRSELEGRRRKINARARGWKEVRRKDGPKGVFFRQARFAICCSH